MKSLADPAKNYTVIIHNCIRSNWLSPSSFSSNTKHCVFLHVTAKVVIPVHHPHPHSKETHTHTHTPFNTYTAKPVCWNGWISDSYCSLTPLCSGMGEVVPARTSPTLLPPSPRTVLSLSCFKVSQCINCRDWHCKSYINIYICFSVT